MKKRGLRNRFLKPAWTLHKWLGLIFALPVLITALTGALLVHYQWIERSFDQEIFRSSSASEENHLPLEAIISKTSARHPDWNPRFIETPGAKDRNVVISLAAPEGNWTVIADAISGEELVVRAQDQGPRRWLLALHANLFLGSTGDWIVGATSLMLLVAGVTGLWLYGKGWEYPFRLRTLLKDSHRHIGFYNLLFLVIIALTGFLLTLTNILSGKKPFEPAQIDWSNIPSLDAMVDAALDASGGGTPDYLALPRNADDSFHIAIFHRHRNWWEKFDQFEFDAKTGALTASYLGTGDDIVMKVNSLVGALHFGHQGGFIMKWLYFVSGSISCWLAISGFIIWKRRRKKR